MLIGVLGLMNEDIHILVVDDDERLRSLLRNYLTKEGFRVTQAEDAKDARAKMSGLAFDLMILDVMMPGESGLELAKSIRQTSGVPILMLTSVREEASRRRYELETGLELDVDDYVEKPMSPDVLIDRVSKLIKKKG